MELYFDTSKAFDPNIRINSRKQPIIQWLEKHIGKVTHLNGYFTYGSGWGIEFCTGQKQFFVNVETIDEPLVTLFYLRFA